MALTSTDAVMTHIGTGLTATEGPFLTQLLTAVEKVFLDFIDRDIISQEYTDFYCGNNQQILRLTEYPVTAVTNVWEDQFSYWGTGTDAFPTGSLLVQGEDYSPVKDGRNGAMATGRLMRLGTVWPGRFVAKSGLLSYQAKPGEGNIKVQYTAGYAAVPADIPLALWEMCAQIRRSRAYGNMVLSGEGYENYNYSLQQLAINILTLGSVNQIASKYRRMTPRHAQLS